MKTIWQVVVGVCLLAGGTWAGIQIVKELGCTPGPSAVALTLYSGASVVALIGGFYLAVRVRAPSQAMAPDAKPLRLFVLSNILGALLGAFALGFLLSPLVTARLPRCRPPDIPPTSTPAPTTLSATVLEPEDGGRVPLAVTVTGSISQIPEGTRAYLIVRPLPYREPSFPQGEILPDARGMWSVATIYKTSGARYETLVVATADPEAIALLGDPNSRVGGIWDMPASVMPISHVILVTRD